MVDTIIFDSEGIVIDTESIWDKSQEEFLKRRGCTYNREKIKPLLTGRTVAEGVEVLKHEYGFTGDTDQLAKERTDIVRDLFSHEVNYIDGFLEFYNSVVSQGYKTCIATAMDKELVDLIDQRLGLKELFHGQIYTPTDVENKSKPNPDLFLYAAKKLGSLPKQCLVIEDSPLGISAAINAKMRCIAITTTYPRSLLTEADVIVNSYSEIELYDIEMQTRRGYAQKNTHFYKKQHNG